MLSLFEGGLGMMPFKGFLILVAAKAAVPNLANHGGVLLAPPPASTYPRKLLLPLPGTVS